MKPILSRSKQLMFVISTSILASSCASKDETVKMAEIRAKVTVQSIVKSGLRETLSYSGTIQAENVTQIGFSIPGRVIEVNVLEGQHVYEGQLLGVVDATEYENALSIANATFEQAEDNFRRSDAAHQTGGLTDRDLVVIKTALEQARANKKLAEKHFADTHLKAPFSGVISAKLIERGTTVQPGVAAFTIEKTDQVYAKATVPESEIGKMRNGTGAIVTIDKEKDTIRGSVGIINPHADANSRTFDVKIRIPNDGERLRPGIIANIQIATGNAVETLVIPGDAVVRDADNITYVFLVAGDSKAILKRITVGGLSDNGIIVTSGLHEGDKLVVSGQNNIRDGQVVSIN